MMGGLLAGVGGWSMYSDTVHQFSGKPSTATLIEHIKECTVEYQRIGEDKRKDPMACATAEALQQRIGPERIKISRDFFARVRFSLADGRAHEAKVEESKLGSHQLPVGAEIAVVYAPDQPADVRAVLTWEGLKGSLMLFAGGLVLLMLAFAGQIAALFAWAFRSRTSPVDNESRPAVAVSGRAALPTRGFEPYAPFGRRNNK